MSILTTSLWAIVALLLCAPLAALTAVALERARSSDPSVACLRFLSHLPLAALALALSGTHGWLGWWALGGYAPLTLALREAFRAVDPRELQAADALGLSPWQVAQTVTLPLVLRPALAAALRTLARLVGEAGLFLVVGGPTLGAEVWQGGLVPAHRARQQECAHRLELARQRQRL